MHDTRLRGIRRQVKVRYLRPLACALATLQRRRLTRPVFVGITGTAGKTTTNELTAAVLDRLGPGIKSCDGYNTTKNVVRCLLKTTQHHRYCVQELGAAGPGTLDQMLKCLKPHIGVVLNVGLEHYSAFRTPEAVALEKGRLVEALPPTGTAILNADDPRVLAMCTRTSASVVTVGLSHEADVRAEHVHSAWPQPLRLDIVSDGCRQHVESQLHGNHWAYAVLAAFAVGRCLGVSPGDAAEAIAGAAPVTGRFETITLPNGASILCDDFKFPYWNVDTFLEVIEQAEADRKLIVFGTMSDYAGASSPKYRQVARKALQVADVVVYVGRRFASSMRKVDAAPGRLVACTDLDEAKDYLTRTLRAGDLVVLKGSDKADNLRSVLGLEPIYECRPEVE